MRVAYLLLSTCQTAVVVPKLVANVVNSIEVLFTVPVVELFC